MMVSWCFVDGLFLTWESIAGLINEFMCIYSSAESGQVVHMLSVTMNPVPPVAWVGISATKLITLTSPRCEEDA